MNDTWYIVAGGPSLKGYNWNRLRNKNVIAVNRSFEKLPNAKYIYFSDKRFFEWFEKGVIAHKAIKVTGSNLVHNDVLNYKFTGRKGLDTKPGCLRSGNDSTYAALNLAYHIGARRIIVLGLDMHFSEDGESHWHNGYATLNTLKHLNKMLPFYKHIAKPLKDLGIKVYNANMDSGVDVFDKIPLEIAHDV